jgi:hypothetical protein
MLPEVQSVITDKWKVNISSCSVSALPYVISQLKTQENLLYHVYPIFT